MDNIVTLGGREFALRPLTLGEVRPVLDALDGLAGLGAKTGGGALLDAAARIVHAGLAGGAPGLTLDDVLALPATVDEVNRAVAAVLRLAGLVPTEPRPGEPRPMEPQPGELRAAGPDAAISAPASPRSAPPSPPAAAGITRPSPA